VGVLDRFQAIGLLGLRLALGLIMMAHGKGKVFGGIGEHYQFVSSLGLPGWLAYPSAIAEFFGGFLLIAGLITRWAALAVLINLLVAMFWVHWSKGFFARTGGYEFTLALAAMAFALMFTGAGALSLDRVLFGRRRKE
jgi:putative oxidoreductase